MKALRLLTLALVSAAAFGGALTSASTAQADGETLKEAMQAYNEGKLEDALAKLQEYCASNPADEEVYALLRTVDEKVLIRALSQRGEHERLMKYLLGKARPPAAEQAADAEALAAKVNDAITNADFDVRRRAAMELRAYGDLAVPGIVPHLGSSDAATVVNAMQALRYLGQDGTLALVEVLSSDDARTRAFAAAALGQVGDPRAAAALTRVAQNDADPSAKERALEALAALKVPSGSAADAYVAIGERYYGNDASVVEGFEATRNLWRWESGALVRYTTPSYLYPYQLAEECASDALALDASHGGARSLLVRAVLAQKVEGDVLTGNGKEAPAALAGAMNVAASQGFAAASAALAATLKNQDWDVAVECCDLCAMTYGKEDLKGHSLGDALVAPERRVRYAAAIACLKMSPKRSGLANADKVADLAARAASERSYRQVLVIDDNDETRAKLVLELGHSKFVAAGEDNGWEGLARAKASPTLDVVVIAAALGDEDRTVPSKRHYSSLAVIDELMADARTASVKIVVRVDATPEAKAEAVQKFFQDKYGDKVAGYVMTPLVASAALQTIEAAAAQVDLNPDQVRANKLAVKAAQAIATTDFSCQSFDLTVTVDPLVEAVTGSDSSPELKLAAVQALGNVRSGGGAALVKALTEGDDALKAAAATALGRLLAGTDGTAEEVDALIAASKAEGEVGAAALAALGQVKRMTPEQRNQAFADHRLPLATKAE
jgi:HEAT repeat protein